MVQLFEHYPLIEYPLTTVQLVLFMVSMGATLSLGDFAPVFRQPRDLLFGVFNQLIVMAPAALLFGYLFELPDGITVGLILVGALPGGTLSNVFTYLSRGNVALSIGLSATATLFSIVTIPVLLGWLAAGRVAEDFEMPVLRIVLEISLFLLLPLACGMAIGRFWPRHKDYIARWCLSLGLALVAVMVVGSMGSGRIDPWDYGWGVPLALILFCVTAQQLAMLPYRLVRADPYNSVAIGLEITVRNIYLGLMLKASLFPATVSADPIGDGVLFVLLFYGAVMLAVALPLSMRLRRVIQRRHQKQQDHQPILE